MSDRRKALRRDAQKIPLVLLAGLPNPLAAAMRNRIEEELSPAPHVIAVSSGGDNRELYKPQTVAALLKGTSEYAIRQQKAQTPALVPAQILLAYVPADDQERLLTEFDFFVFPVALARLAEYNDHGRQHRHDLKEVQAYIPESLRIALNSFATVKRRLSSPSARESLLLPPRNFHVSSTQKLAEIFLDLRRNSRPWSSPIEEVRVQKVTHEQLRKHVRRGEHKEVLIDYRNLLFPQDFSAHGHVRELAGDCTDQERKEFMRSAFRFGVPLPGGYHHDAQYSERDLGGTIFECCRAGRLQLHCAYANVYPNDFVRACK